MKYTPEQLENALVGAKSIKDVICNLGLNVNNGQYRALKGHYLRAGVEFPKFINKGNPESIRSYSFIAMPDEEFFVRDYPRNGSQLKSRLVKAGRKLVCVDCGVGSEWNSKPLTLQVDHIDGNRFNNLKENLQFLCPNCHSQTKTFGRSTEEKHYKYCDCGARIHHTSQMCRSCAAQNATPRFDWPPPNEVLELVQKTNFWQAGKTLGVSDNAVRKFLKRTGMI